MSRAPRITFLSGILIHALIGVGCGELPGDPETAWIQRETPGHEMADVACSENRVVAVGWGVLTSPDGISWTTARVPDDWRMKSVTRRGALFVAVGNTVPRPGRPIVATSSDGLTWVEGTAPAFIDDVAWSGELFIGIDDRTVFSSRDGMTWDSRKLEIKGMPRRVAWGGSQFVAVGYTSEFDPNSEYYTDRALVLTSPDGMTWSEQSAPGSGLYDVTWAGERFVAVGRSILTSPDGSTWNLQNIPVEEYALNGITWSGSQFAAVGTARSEDEGLVMTSPDGLAWERHRVPVHRAKPAAVAWCGSRFVAVGALRQGFIAGYTSDLVLTSQ